MASLQSETTKNISFIDEWDINSVQSTYRRELAYYFAKKMYEIFYDVISSKCDGCIDDQPNQQAHDICLQPVDLQILVCFDALLHNVDEVAANEYVFKNNTSMLPINSKKMYLSKEYLKLDIEWLLQVKRLLLEKFE